MDGFNIHIVIHR